MDVANMEFMINLLIQRIALIEQVNQDILRTQMKEQGMIVSLNNSVQQIKVQVNAISIRQSAQGGGNDGMLRSSLNSKI